MHAAALRGFHVEPIAITDGFLSSIVTDSRGTIYYTTTAGDIARLDGAVSTVVAHVLTNATGNAGLLGMALRNDPTAIVHYTQPDLKFEIISSIDLTTGEETVIHAFQDDIRLLRAVSSEHHGGNPIVADDGSIFVAFGDGDNPLVAGLPDWNTGKIFRILPDGSVTQFARGVRNPFDLSWNSAAQRLVAPDNGDVANDEINIVHEGDDLGWPSTMNGAPAAAGTTTPAYTFRTTVAPTGIVELNGRNAMLSSGYLLGAFVTSALYYIRDIDAPQPIAVIQNETEPIIDVTESRTGEIYFATGRTIYRLEVPRRGDCNGDGIVNNDDMIWLLYELMYGPHRDIDAQAGSWGCDVNGDQRIDEADIPAMQFRINVRRRTVR